MSRSDATIFTIGHSSHSLERFIAMLGAAGADTIVDVRSFARSRANPQFNTETLPHQLSVHQIGYDHWPNLGGRRKIQDKVPPETNGLWNNPSFHNYADYALTAPFQTDISRLIELAGRRTPALMCSEAVWWRCHRRIIADYLIARDIEVMHIMGVGKTTAAKLTPGATLAADRTVRYPGPAP